MNYRTDKIMRAVWRRRHDKEVWALLTSLAGTAYMLTVGNSAEASTCWVPTFLVLNGILLASVIRSALHRRVHWHQLMDVAESDVCPEWFLQDAMSRAADQGFYKEFLQAYLDLPYPPTGVDVVRTFNEVKERHMEKQRTMASSRVM